VTGGAGRRRLARWAAIGASLAVGLAALPVSAGGGLAVAPRAGVLPLAADIPGDAPSGGPPLNQAISADGRFVAFGSEADDLVPGDTNKTPDMFIRDRAAGVTIRVPWVDGSPLLPVGLSVAEPTLSANGSVLAFTAFAVSGVLDFPGIAPRTSFPVVVVFSGGVTRVASGSARHPSLSGDGSRLAVAGLGDGSTVRIITPSGGAVASVGSGSQPVLSADGQTVAYQAGTQVVERSLAAGSSVLVSGSGTDGNAFDPSISADGRFVAFTSTGTTLVAAPLDGSAQVFVWDRTTGQLRLASTDRNGAPGRGASFHPAISGDGRFVAFTSMAPDMDTTTPTGDGGLGVYVHDLVTGHTIRASAGSEAGDARSGNGGPSIDADGGVVAFDGPGTNGFRQVYVREWSPAPIAFPTPLDFGAVDVGQRSGTLTVSISNAGWRPYTVTSTSLDATDPAFAVDGSACTGKVLYYAETCPVDVTFAPTEVGERVVTLLVKPSAGQPPSVRVRGTTPTATPTGPTTSRPPGRGEGGGGGGSEFTPILMLDPPLGPPGFVTIAVGTGFPPNSLVTLAWDRGLSAPEPATRVGADGTFRTPVIVLPHSDQGPRMLLASSAGGDASFAPAQAPFLVVPGTAQPPGAGAVQFINPSLKPITNRR
jgi:Tol biopolymer transport system component